MYLSFNIYILYGSSYDSVDICILCSLVFCAFLLTLWSNWRSTQTMCRFVCIVFHQTWSWWAPFFLKKMWDNLRHDELQEHLAPSGYLKIPTVSITRNAPFMLFGWHATLLLLWMYFWVVYCTGQSTGTAYFTGLSKHIYRPNCISCS